MRDDTWKMEVYPTCIRRRAGLLKAPAECARSTARAQTTTDRRAISLDQAQYASSTINLRLAAIRRLAYEAAACGLLSAGVAAGMRRVKAES